MQTLACGERPSSRREALRYRGGAQMSAPPCGPLRPLLHTEPHTPSHTATPTRFSCCRCGFESHVDYYGRTPPFNRSVVFLEAVYLIHSPMGDANRPLCLGGTCVVWCATTNPSLSHHHAWHTLTSEPRLRAAPLAWHLMLTRSGTEFLVSDHLRMRIHPLRSHGWHAQNPTRMLSHPHARPPAWRLAALASARLTACLPVHLPTAASARCARQLSVASSTQSASVPTASPGPRSPRRSHLHLPQPQALRQQAPPLVRRRLPPCRNPKRRKDFFENKGRDCPPFCSSASVISGLRRQACSTRWNRPGLLRWRPCGVAASCVPPRSGAYG